MLKREEVDYVIYHHPCSDGCGSGLIAWKYLSEHFPEREVRYYPAQIGTPPPLDLAGRNVLICDYSYPKAILTELIGRVKGLLVLDHHKSAEKELAEIPPEYKVFDMGHSGAYLTWKFFYPDEPVPLLISYIEDRDLWRRDLPFSLEFGAWFYTLPLEFPVYSQYLDQDKLLEMVQSRGPAFQELNQSYITQALEHVTVKFTKVKGRDGKDKFYFIGYINSSILKSDIGNSIFTKFPHIDFSAVYSIHDYNNSTGFSLRSTEKHVDVSEIALTFGGGGHRNAAGVYLNLVTNTLPGIVYDSGDLYSRITNLYYEEKYFPGLGLYNVVYLYYPKHQGKIGQYLLQIKYTDTYGPVQNCSAILSEQYGLREYPLVAVWTYDPFTDQTTFTLSFSRTVPDKTIEQISQALSLNEKRKTTYPGSRKFLPPL